MSVPAVSPEWTIASLRALTMRDCCSMDSNCSPSMRSFGPTRKYQSMPRWVRKVAGAPLSTNGTPIRSVRSLATAVTCVSPTFTSPATRCAVTRRTAWVAARSGSPAVSPGSIRNVAPPRPGIPAPAASGSATFDDSFTSPAASWAPRTASRPTVPRGPVSGASSPMRTCEDTPDRSVLGDPVQAASRTAVPAARSERRHTLISDAISILSTRNETLKRSHLSEWNTSYRPRISIIPHTLHGMFTSGTY
jgi:hypothetical protein